MSLSHVTIVESMAGNLQMMSEPSKDQGWQPLKDFVFMHGGFSGAHSAAHGHRGRNHIAGKLHNTPKLPKLEQQKLASDSVYTSRKKQEATTNVTNIERQCCSTTQTLPPPPSATTVDTTNTTAPTAEAADNLSDEVADTILQSPTPTKCYYC